MFKQKWFDFPMIIGTLIAAFIWWQGKGAQAADVAGFVVVIVAAVFGLIANALFG